MILDRIKHPNDIHRIPLADFPLLADEIRQFLIETVSRTGGHLASNLGSVELTIALHNVLHFPQDKLIWDVGHQAYTHKILTGRKNEFATLRQENGLSGFPKRRESECDAFDSGHSSNSISAGLGYVYARDLKAENYTVVSVIGDGALTGGLAYEALNNAAELETNFIIVLNDNTMSISQNVGGVSAYLGGLRTAQSYADMKLRIEKNLQKIPLVGLQLVDTVRRTKSSLKQLLIPGMFFEDMGITYLGPVDGHDMRQMMKTFNEARRVEGAVIVHVLTQKGYGYEPSRLHPDRFHGTGPFDIATGRPLSVSHRPTYTDIFSRTMCEIGREDPNVVAITAAMPEGTGLLPFARRFPQRFFDVGIAEGHAVSFASGLALGGLIPVVSVYSSFLQRGFDQLMMDVCMQNQHVVMAVDRAGLVGADGETHHGCFDLTYLGMMPNMTVMAPSDGRELAMMLRWAVRADGPVAIRYGKEAVPPETEDDPVPIQKGRARIVSRGRKVAILAVGSMVRVCSEAVRLLYRDGILPTLVDMRFVRPFDTALLDDLAGSHRVFITVEENAARGGFGACVSAWTAGNHPKILVRCCALPDGFIEQGSIQSLRRQAGLCPEAVAAVVKQALADEQGILPQAGPSL